jgi:hypothetical protein
MKEIVNSIIEPASLNTATNDKFYGVITFGSKGFIVKENFLDGKYKVITTRHLTRGSQMAIKGDSLQEILILCMQVGHYTYEFDTDRDLFEWLSQP